MKNNKIPANFKGIAIWNEEKTAILHTGNWILLPFESGNIREDLRLWALLAKKYKLVNYYG